MAEQTIAIGLYCHKCSVQAHIHHVYLCGNVMYLQGPCSRCGEPIKFSADNLLISLMQSNQETKRVDRSVQ